jgi:hypothetical protein
LAKIEIGAGVAVKVMCVLCDVFVFATVAMNGRVWLIVRGERVLVVFHDMSFATANNLRIDELDDLESGR